jgi:hypothetical protein
MNIGGIGQTGTCPPIDGIWRRNIFFSPFAFGCRHFAFLTPPHRIRPPPSHRRHHPLTVVTGHDVHAPVRTAVRSPTIVTARPHRPCPASPPPTPWCPGRPSSLAWSTGAVRALVPNVAGAAGQLSRAPPDPRTSSRGPSSQTPSRPFESHPGPPSSPTRPPSARPMLTNHS